MEKLLALAALTKLQRRLLFCQRLSR